VKSSRDTSQDQGAWKIHSSLSACTVWDFSPWPSHGISLWRYTWKLFTTTDVNYRWNFLSRFVLSRPRPRTKLTIT